MRVLFPFTGTLLGGSYESAGLVARQLQESPDVSVIIALPYEGRNAKRFREYGLEPIFYNPSSSFMEGGRKIEGWTDRLEMALYTVGQLPIATSFIASHGIDLVHIHDDRSMWLWGLAARILGVPVVWHVRQVEGNHVLDWMRTRLATKVICISESTKDRISINSPEVIPNPVDTELFTPPGSQRRIRRMELGLKPERTTLGFIGRLVGKKRPEWIVEAGRRLVEEGVDLQVVIVGGDRSGGRYTAELKKQAQAGCEGCRDRFSWLGYRNDVHQIIQSIDVLGVPSAEEGFGRVIIEAMAAGVPVVATECGGPSEIIRHEETGILVPRDSFEGFTNGLKEMLLNPGARVRMGAAARRIVEEEYDTVKIVRKLIRVYRTII